MISPFLRAVYPRDSPLLRLMVSVTLWIAMTATRQPRCTRKNPSPIFSSISRSVIVVRYTWSPSTWIFAYFPFIRTYKIVLTLKAIVFLSETIVMYLSSGMKHFLRKILYFIEAFISEIISGFHSRINSSCTRCRNLDF